MVCHHENYKEYQCKSVLSMYKMRCKKCKVNDMAVYEVV